MTEMKMKENRSHHHTHTSTPQKLEFEYLRRITENFSEANIIGTGGFGIVYKGKKDNGELVAVKKLKNIPGKAIEHKQFSNEVKHVNSISHPNIVRLEGYCYKVDGEFVAHEGTQPLVEQMDRLLCFEYLPNGSLDAYLEDKFCVPDWNERYKIILGICKGLHYLHEDRDILHLDLKPGNVLLDKDMIPKIADFGQSRRCRLGEGNTHTIHVVGTPGYMAPEYRLHGKITKKADIYSLGILIMEILTGEKYPTDDQLGKARRKWKGRLETTSRSEEYKHLENCIAVALKCKQERPEERPDIKRIIEIILGISEKMNDHPVGTRDHSVVPIDQRPGVWKRCTTPNQTYIGIETPDGNSPEKDKRTGRKTCKTGRMVFCTIAIATMLAIPVIALGFLRDLSITVEDASLTKYDLTTTPTLMFDYNISVTLRIYNPNWVMSLKSTGPLEAVYSFDGKRFDRVQVVEADNPSWVRMSNRKTGPLEAIYSFDGEHFDGMELVEADHLPAQRSRIYSIQMFPESKYVALGSTGMSNYMKQKKTGVLEVAVALVGQVISTGRLTKCKPVAICPLKLHLAPPAGIAAPPFAKVKCSLASGGKKCGCNGVRAFPWRSGVFVKE